MAVEKVIEVSSLAQCGQTQCQAVEAVVQVLAKTPLLDLTRKVTVGCTDQRKINGYGLAPPQGRHLAVLQYTQQARLQGQRHVTDFVQEQGSAIGLTDAPWRPLSPSASESAGLVAKQLRFYQRFRQSRAVDGNKGLVLARPALVQRSRKDFFAHTRLTLQQQGDGLVYHLAGTGDRRAQRGVTRINACQRILWHRRSVLVHLRVAE